MIENNTEQQRGKSIVAAAYRSLGYEVRFRATPARRALMEARIGKTDATLARIKKVSKRYPELRIIPVPIVAVRFQAYGKRSTPYITSWENLKDLNVGYMHGVIVMEQKTEHLKRQRADTLETLFRKIHHDRVDVALASETNAQRLLTSSFQGSGIVARSNTLIEVSLYHHIHERHSGLVPALTKAINTLKASGRYDGA